jgi:hypothetical protein
MNAPKNNTKKTIVNAKLFSRNLLSRNMRQDAHAPA